jgi:phage tail sheath protein FI
MPEYLSPGVYVEEFEIGPKPIEGVSTSTIAFIGGAMKGPILEPTFVDSWSTFESTFGGLISNPMIYLGYAVDAFFRNGGKRAYIVRVASSTDNLSAIDPTTGLAPLEKYRGISLLAIPGGTSQSVQQAMIDHCEKMRYRFAILDSEPKADIAGIKKQRESLNSRKGHAALYYPWLQIVDHVSNKNIYLPPSGMVAGIYARSDGERGVHKAPANVTVAGAIGLERSFTRGEQDVLNTSGINVIRYFPGRGIMVWGARTVASDSLWKYVNVRRLFIFLEESIENGTQWVVFEPDNEKLWAKVKATITDFLMSVWRDGALMGTKPEEAFFVKCDRTTMIQNDIDTGRLIVVIGIAPVKPAEFVIFRIAQWQGGSAVTE